MTGPGRGFAGWIAVVGVMIPLAGVAKPPARPEAAIRALATAQGDDLQAAVDLLKSRPDLLRRHGQALARLVGQAPGDSDVAVRVLGLVHDRGEEGCRFIARLADGKHPAWLDEVLRRYPLLPRCEALRKAVAGVLAWAGDPESSATAARLVDQVIALVRQTREALVPEAACRLVLAGPEGRRREAISMVLDAAPSWSERCLVRAYHDEARADGRLRADLLQAVAALAGVDSIPTLIVALDHPPDHDLACGLVRSAGPAGLAGLLFAVRTSQTPSEGVSRCLIAIGTPAMDEVLPLLDHPSEGIRSFVTRYLERHQTDAALAELKSRYERGDGKVARVVLLDLIGRYPAEAVRNILHRALQDDDRGLRLRALDIIERRRDLDDSAAVLASAEEDPAEDVRIRALEVAWHLGAPDLAALAIRMVQYEKPAVAAQAAKVLGFVGGAGAPDVLRPLLKAREEEVAKAAETSLWLLTFRDPSQGDEKARATPGVEVPKGGREVTVEGGRALVYGKKGPLVVVLPGGPGMDFTWIHPILSDLADDALVALLEPSTEPGAEAIRLVRPATFRALLAAMERTRAVVVSQGLGGTAALWLSTLEPDAVAGVVAVGSPLPGAVNGMDEAVLAGLTEPFKTAAEDLVSRQAAFRPEVLNRDIARVMAPALAGKAGKPWTLLAVAWDVLAYGQTGAVLSRPEVRYSPAEFPGPVLFILPASRLPEPVMESFRSVKAQAPDRVSIEDLGECGFLPVTECGSRVRRLVEKFVKRAVEDGRR